MIDLWQKKRFFDLWSIPHFLFGIIWAFLPSIFDITYETSFLAMVIAALIWEVCEKFLEVKETVWNSVIDIILPIISFFLTVQILNFQQLQKEEVIVYFLGVLALYIFTNISGWLAFRRRQRDFTH